MKTDATIAMRCPKCGTDFVVPESACRTLFLDFDDGRGGLTGNRGLWHDCPTCGRHVGVVD